MKINPNEISSVLKKELDKFDSDFQLEEEGTIIEVGDGIARVYGLSNACAGEMLEFSNGSNGLAFNLEESSIGAVILGEYEDLREGDPVKRTGGVVRVPVGDALVGRVVTPLGHPIDGKGPINAKEYRPVEFNAPGIADRQPVKEPLQTGIKAIDSMIPIGRGQRELIIGDRGTGKTAIAVDAILNQKGKDVICVYVAIGQKASTVAGVVERLTQSDAMDYTIVVNAPASAPAPLQYIAPYAGVAMAEHFNLQRRTHAVRLRRSDEAGGGVPSDVPPPAPSAGTRGVPGRRLLPPLATPREGGEALRRPRRGIAHRASRHRDPGGRGLRVHPDERDLDHRRADLSAAGPVLRRGEARDRRRHLGVARRGERAGEGHEADRRLAAARPGAVPRARGVRPARNGARQGHPGAARPGLPHGGAAQAGISTCRWTWWTRSSRSGPERRATSTSSR